MLLLNCVLLGIKTCAFTEGTELCRILHPMVNESLTCATASTFQLHSFPPLMPHGYTCLLPLAFAVIRTMKLRGPVSAASHIKKGKQKQHSRQRSPEHQLHNKLRHLQATPSVHSSFGDSMVVDGSSLVLGFANYSVRET